MITKFKDLQHQRVYIRNFVDRYYKGSKKCVNCGKEPTTIVHNEEDPYNVSFICDDCRLGLDKEDLLKLKKVNLLDNIEVNRKFSHTKNLVLTDKIKSILENALTTDKPLVKYLRENELSYNKYKEAIRLYESQYEPIKDRLYEHFNELRGKKVSNTIRSKSANKND